MYKWLVAGFVVGFGIGLFLASTIFETWLSPFGTPVTINYTIWDWSPQINIWKSIGTVWLLTGIIGTYLLYKVSYKTKPLPKPSKNAQKPNVEIAEESTQKESRKTTVNMASMEDLLKVANTIAKPILHQKLTSETAGKELSNVFYVSDGSIQYQFVKMQPIKAPSSTSTTVSSTNPSTDCSQKKHLIIKDRYLLSLGSMALCVIFVAMCFAVFLPRLGPTIPRHASSIALLILAITAIIGFTSIIFRRMKRK